MLTVPRSLYLPTGRLYACERAFHPLFNLANDAHTMLGAQNDSNLMNASAGGNDEPTLAGKKRLTSDQQAEARTQSGPANPTGGTPLLKKK